MPLPIEVGVWKKRTAGQGWGQVSEIQTWTDVSFEARFNQPGPWDLSIPIGAQVFELTKTHLVTFDYRGVRYTGTVEDFGAETDENGRPLLKVIGLDVLSWIGDALGWPTPTAPITAQTEIRWYASGPAETVLRDLISANLTNRLGYEISYPIDQGRGASVTVNSTFGNVLEIVREKVNLAGLGVRMNLVNAAQSTRADLTVEFYVPADKSVRVVLSHRVGSLRGWKQSDQIPTATRAIVQASKEQDSLDVVAVDTVANTIATPTGARKIVRTRQIESVNTSLDRITTKSTHGFGKGDRITFTGGTPPAPLVPGTDYFAIRVDADTLKVASSVANANADTALNLTTVGAGTVTINRIRISDLDNRLRTGDIVTFTGGIPPAPLEVGVPYHAIRVNDHTFKVAMTRADALEGVAVDLTTAGSGQIQVTEESRSYREVIDDAAETEWGRKREVLVVGDAEDTEGSLDDAGLQALADAAGQSGFELETAEAEGMRYGTHYGLGDLVTVELLTGVSSVQALGAVQVSGDAESGITVKAIPGNPDAVNPMFGQAAILRGFRRQIGALQRKES